MPKSTNRTNSMPKQSIPPPAHSPPAPSSPSMVDSMKQGFSFGLGSSVAHNVINATFNSKNKDETVNTKEITNETKLTSEKIYEVYNKCLEKNDNNIDCNIILENTINK